MEKTLHNKYQGLKVILLETIADFRSGHDISGLNAFFTTIEDIENIILISIYLDELEFVDVLLPVARTLHDAVCNEDVTGLTDILEYTFLPYVENAVKEVTEA